jgi:hypothetical protein
MRRYAVGPDFRRGGEAATLGQLGGSVAADRLSAVSVLARRLAAAGAGLRIQDSGAP